MEPFSKQQQQTWKTVRAFVLPVRISNLLSLFQRVRSHLNSWISNELNFCFVQNYLITVFAGLKNSQQNNFLRMKSSFLQNGIFFAENFGAKPLIFWLHRVMIILTREVPFREMAAAAVLTPKERRGEVARLRNKNFRGISAEFLGVK